MTLAQLLQSDPRPLPAVMADAVANADAAMTDARLRLLEGEEVSITQLDRLLELSRLAHHLSRTMLETGIFAKVAAEQRATVGELGTFISEVLLGVLHSLPLTPAWREYLLDVADYRLLELRATREPACWSYPRVRHPRSRRHPPDRSCSPSLWPPRGDSPQP
jgi:hypothetical protein